MAQRIARVIPLLRLQRDLTSFGYLIPPSLEAQIARGSLVWIPFRSHTVGGVVEHLASATETSSHRLKVIEGLVSEVPLSEFFFRVGDYLQKSFAISPGLAFKTMLPPLIKKHRDAPIIPTLRLETRIKRSRLSEIKNCQTQLSTLLAQKKSCLAVVMDESEKWALIAALFKGPLARNKQVLIVVPDEFHLEQWRRFLATTFPAKKFSTLSSSIPPSQQFRAFEDFRSGHASVMLGTKLAIFSASPACEFLVLDEEESETHKQYDQNPRYDVRSILRFYEQQGIPSLQFSRAPRTEAYGEAKRKHCLASLLARTPLPPIQTLDREEEFRKSSPGMLPDRMVEGIRQTLIDGRQAFLFFNRKGFAKLLFCRDCQTLQRCALCTWPLQLTAQKQIWCPSCNEARTSDRCLTCGSYRLRPSRLGLTALASEVEAHFPKTPVQILDAEHPTGRDAPLICGTQFALPRLPWGNIGIVCWITPELTFSISGFEVSDHLFQTLKFFQAKLLNTFGAQLQILTHLPNHPCFQLANSSGLDPYYVQELKAREEYGYPPSRRLIKLIFFHKDAIVNESLAQKTRQSLTDLHHPNIREVSQPYSGASLLGGAKERRFLLLKVDPETNLLDLSSLLPDSTLVDVDPLTV